MPNHVTNVIKMVGPTDHIREIISKVTDGQGRIDFQNIIPNDPETRTTNVEQWGTKWNAYSHSLPYDVIKWKRWHRSNHPFSHTHEGRIYPIRVSKKRWNRYFKKNTPDELRFQTAWSAPFPIFQKLASLYPDVEFRIQYADEDIGYNCGYIILKGDILEEFEQAQRDCSEETRRKWRKYAFNLAYPGVDPKSHCYNDDWEYDETLEG